MENKAEVKEDRRLAEIARRRAVMEDLRARGLTGPEPMVRVIPKGQKYPKGELMPVAIFNMIKGEPMSQQKRQALQQNVVGKHNQKAKERLKREQARQEKLNQVELAAQKAAMVKSDSEVV